MTNLIAPEFEVTEWLNTDLPLSLEALRGRIVLVEVFQMLCPGCVSHSLPQAMKVAQTFSSDDVAVIGLHSVFEHHAGQGTREALSAFLHEYRITFPVAMDALGNSGPIPKTMEKYRMRGTPTYLLIDRNGNLRDHSFGRADDMAMGAKIMSMIKEPATVPALGKAATCAQEGCDENGCALPT